jgi:hypothetical protein
MNPSLESLAHISDPTLSTAVQSLREIPPTVKRCLAFQYRTLSKNSNTDKRIHNRRASISRES